VSGPSDTDVDALSSELVRLVRLVDRVRADCVAQCRGELEQAAYVLLSRLLTDGPQRISALAEAVHSDPSTVSRQTTQLVARGLVERRPDPQDGRAARLTPTEAGLAVHDEHRRTRNQHIAAVLTGWPTQDVRQLVALLGRLNTDFENYRTHVAAEGIAP
jgi:DNA-binding MarR family transcriptional regulator